MIFQRKNPAEKKAKIFTPRNPFVMRVCGAFLKRKNARIRQAYIGGEDFGVHNSRNRGIIAAGGVQRRSGRNPVFYRAGNRLGIVGIRADTPEQKRSQSPGNIGGAQTFAKGRQRFSVGRTVPLCGAGFGEAADHRELSLLA